MLAISDAGEKPRILTGSLQSCLRWLQLGRTGARGLTATIIASSRHGLQDMMQMPDRPEPVDMRVLAEMLEDDLVAMEEMLADFRVNARNTAAELRTACREGPTADTAALAHRLKSSSRWVGAMALGDICAAMEQAGHAGQSSRLVALMACFEAELSEVERFLAAR